MKISPIATGGQNIGNVEVGQAHSPEKMERARTIARGETPQEPTGDAQVDRIRNSTRKITMKTNFSTNRELPPQVEMPSEPAPEPAVEPAKPVSGTQDVVEQAPVEATQPLSPQFAALAKQKRAIQLERADLDKQKADMINAAELKSNPLGVLQKHGVSYDQLTEAILNTNQSNPEIQELKKEIQALKEGVDKSFQTREQANEEAALTEMLYEAEALSKDGEDFELIRTYDAYDKVLRHIHDNYKKTGRVLDVQEAMSKVEGDLMRDAEKYASINKVKNKYFTPTTPPLQPQQKPGMRTLTARDSAVPQVSARARAIAAFQGTLKK